MRRLLLGCMNKLRRKIALQSEIISLFLEIIIIAIVLIKVFFLSADQMKLNEALVKISKEHIYALENLRSLQKSKDFESLQNLRKRLENSSNELLKFIGRNQAVCRSKAGIVWTIQTVSDTPIAGLINQDMASGMTLGDGSKCENSLEDAGLLARMGLKDASSYWAEIAVVFLSIFLLWVKVERGLFETKFPPRRKSENGIPYYLTGSN